MDIYGVILPGARVTSVGGENGSQLFLLFFSMACSLADASISLSDFDAAQEASAAFDFASMDPEARTLIQRRPFIAAKGFLFGLDEVAKTLGVLNNMDAAPAQLDQVVQEWLRAFPQLAAVRNSAHHMEDRLRGLGANKKPIEPQVLDEPGLMKAPPGNYVHASLIHRTFATLLADGQLGKVDITPEALAEAARMAQRAVECYTWEGPPLRLPT